MKKRILLTMFLLAFALFAKAVDGNHWQFNVNAENTMTCTAVLYIDGVTMQNDANAQAYEIGAFIGDECVSSYIPDAFPTLPFVSGYGYNFMFHSNSASGTITFRVYNHVTGQEMECTHNCPTTLAFVKDGNQGNLQDLFHIELFADPTIICYDIDATANPAAGGTVTGGGTFKPGRTCKLTATANTGYDFVNWTLGGTQVSTNAVYSFTVSEDAEYVANFQIKTYAITVAADPTAGGTVTGANTYEYGSTCTLTATPALGYQFVNWTKGGVEVSTNATYSFTATDGVAGEYVAHFSMEPYVITASANPVEGGTVNVDGPLTHGSTCTLTATPNAHYDFVNWTLAGEVVSTDAEYSFTVTGDGAYVANFELASYEITATVNPAGTGTVSGMGTIVYGQTCTLTATANGGYSFVNWTKGGVEVSTNASYTFTVYEAGAYVANFTAKTYTITVAANPVEGGSVSRKPEPTSGDIYSYGQQVKLRAVPKLGYEFVNWTKSSANKMMKARDGGETLVYTLDGTETSSGNAYANPSEVTQNNMTWMVTGNTEMSPWRIGGKNLTDVDRPIYSTQTISDDITKIVVEHGTASNITVNSMTLIVSANSDFSNPTSTLTGDFVAESTTTFNRPDGVSWAGKYYKIVYNVSVSGNSNRFVQFVGATLYKDNNGGGGGNDPINMDEPEITITVNDDNEGAYTANFQTVVLPAVPTETHWTSVTGLQYTMNITGIMILDGESMKNNDIDQYLEIGAFVGDECRGSFLPTTYDLPFAQGYYYEMTINGNNNGEQVVFRVWNHINNEELDVTSLSNTTFIVDGNLGDLMTPQELEFETNLTAHYNIVATANIPEAGTVTGSGSYEEDTECTLVATVNEHYNFINWTKGNEVVSTNASYTFTVTADGTYIANFEPEQYEITVVDPQHGTVDGAGTYAYNTQCVLTATPDEGYHFVNWTKGGVEVSTEASYAFVVEADASYVATFAINTYDIAVTVSPYLGEENSCGSVTGAGNFEHFATCTLTATPATKWVFENWTENEVIITDEAGDPVGAEYSFTVTGPRNLVANFAPIYTITASVDKDIEVDGVVPGTIEGAGDVIKGQTWTLTETPDAGYTFVNWYEVINEVREFYSDEATISEEAQADREFVAYYTLNSYDITATITPDEVPATATEITVAGIVTGDGTYHHYDTCTMVATPSTGYHFVNWTEGGEEVATTATYEFMVEGQRALVANFELDTLVITATVADVTEVIPEAAPAVPGEVTGYVFDDNHQVVLNYYDICTLTAVPAEGYHFVNWTEGGEEVKDGMGNPVGAEYIFMVTEDRNLVANFELDTHEITVTLVDVTTDIPAAAPAVPGSVTGTGIYNYYATCTLVATPATGYHFVNWTENDVEVATEATYEFMVTEDRALVANFELDTHTIALSVADVTAVIPEAAPAVPGTVTGDGTYNYYAMCTVEATPATGYHFVNWTENGTEVATTAVYEFMVEGDRALVANFALDTHDITVTIVDITTDKPEAAPAVPGEVAGTGTYNYYATCTLVATPATGYHFVNWTENDVEVATEATYEFMVTEDRALKANFELDTHEITVTLVDVTTDIPAAAPAVPGEVTGTGTYNYYATCTLVATPATGYHFVNWTESGTEVATTATYEFMVEGDRALVANFELNTYEIVATINPAETPDNDPDPAGVVTGAGSYNHYAICELTATANTGYDFVNWTLNGNVVSTEATISFEVDGAATYTANFQIKSYQITVYADPTVGGSVEATGYIFDDNHQITVEHFAICELTAIPATGYHFVNWTDENDEVINDLAATETIYSFMVEGARTLKAHFALNEYNITASVLPTETPQGAPSVAGTVDGTGIYQHFATCTLTATPSNGYHFMNWKVNDVEVGTELTYSFEVTGECNVVATFALNSYTIAATDNPTGYGTIEGAGSYTHYSTCSLVATANEGHTFFNWTENNVEVSTNATYSFTVTGPRSLVANFINRYEITVAANPTVGGTVTGGAVYDEGSSVTLIATPATGYHFVNWTLNGNEVSTNATYTFTAQAAGNYIANFAINNYAITAVANPTAGGTVTGAGNYDHFSTCTLTATPATGYHFVNWTKNGTVVTTNTTYSFTVEAAADFVANFELNSYAITATLDPANAGTVTGAGTYNHFATCTLTANPSSSYLFVNWTKNGQVVSTEPTISFTVEGPADYVAHFIPNTYVITTSALPAYAGTVSGAGTYYYLTELTLIATPNVGFHFVNWTKNGQVVSTEASYTFTVTQDEEYVANFASNIYQVTAFVNPAEGGSVSGAGTYSYGQTCVLEAIPNEGYHFVNWTDTDNQVVSTNIAYLFNVYENVAYVANFELNSYTITAAANPVEGGTVEGAGTYNYGESCTLTATANTGYSFVNWTIGNEVVSTNASYTFTVEGDASYVANFELNSYEITAIANPAEGGTVTGDGTYNYGASCTLTATVANGYNFINWTKGNEVVSTETSFSFTVTEDATYVANFEEIVIPTYEITVTANPDDYGTVTGGGTYEEGSTCTVTATATSGHMFVNWTENGEIVSEDATYTFVVTADRELVANFDLDGVDELDGMSFTIYPNPAIDKVMVESSEFVRKCEVYSVNGALIYTMYECSENFEINVSDYAAGSYIIRLTSDKSVKTRSFVKTK